MRKYLMLLLLVWPGALFAQEALKPEQMIIPTQFAPAPLEPQVGAHRYDPRRPEKGAEPYLPNFEASAPDFPLGLGLNLEPHWVVRYAEPFSGMLLGAEGEFQRGVKAYRAQKYLEARDLFAVSAKKSSGLAQQKAYLWMAWSLYHLKDASKALQITQAQRKIADATLAHQAWRLSLMLEIEGKLPSLPQSLEELAQRTDRAQWPFELTYVALIGHQRAGQAGLAKQALQDLERESHSRYYTKIKELAALQAYQSWDLPLALAELKRAQQANPRPNARGQYIRLAAWLHYFNGDFEAALSAVEKALEQSNGYRKEELRYLKAALLVRLNQPQDLPPLLQSMDGKSAFYSYAAFQVRAFLPDYEKQPQIQALVQGKDFAHPELKFYVALLEGHQALVQGQLEDAERWFFKALTVDSSSGLYWIAQYNMGLIHLQKERYAVAAEAFERLRQNQQGEERWLKYHLLFAYYQQNQSTPFDQLRSQTNLESLESDLQWQILAMQASLLYRQGRFTEAAKVFTQGWQQAKNPLGLGYAAQSLYQANRFEEILALRKQYPHPESAVFFQYYVKALLALKRPQEAMNELETRTSQGLELAGLYQEVWLQNQSYDKIIAHFQPLLTKATPLERFQIHNILGDASFNQKKYPAAQASYLAALPLSPGAPEASQTLYNAHLAGSHFEPLETFTSKVEADLTQRPLTPPLRLQLTLLLSDRLESEKQWAKADQVLARYLEKQSLERGQVHLKRAYLKMAAQDFAGCSELAGAAMAGMESLASRDLAIVSGQCGLQSTMDLAKLETRLSTEIKRPETHRLGELQLLLSEVNLRLGKSEAARQLLQEHKGSEKDAFTQGWKRYLTLASQEGKTPAQDLLPQLEDLEPFKVAGRYQEALLLRVRLQENLNRTPQAIKDLLRLYYQKDLPSNVRQSVLLQLTRLTLQQKNLEEAKGYFQQIDPKQIAKADLPLYLELNSKFPNQP